MRSWVLALLAAALAGPPAVAQDLHCPAPFAALLSDKAFSAYAVKMSANDIKPVSPDVRHGRAHLYRTVIRDEAQRGPDFAGKYTIIRIGCGAATACLAIADAQTGKVYFSKIIRSAEALLVDTGDIDVETLNYRRNSRLLIVIGSLNDDQRKAGVSYLVWASGAFRLVRFTPAAKLCSLPPNTRF